MRRIFIIVASLIVVLGLGVGLYFMFASNEPSLTARDGNQFGSADDAPLPTDSEPHVSGPVQAGEFFTQELFRITEDPVARGAVVIAVPSQAEGGTSDPIRGGETEIRYIDRASGNTYAYKVYERTLERIANRTLPGIQEAAWLSDGSMAFVRFLSMNDGVTERVETYALPISGEGGYFLDRGLSQVSVSGTSTLLTLLPSTNGSVATVANVDSTNARTLFSSPLGSLIVHLSNGPFIAATKPSVHTDGYAFTVGAGGAFSRILGPYRGLSVLPSPSGRYVLFTYIESRAMRTAVLDRHDGSIISMPIATLAEKCVWAYGDESIFCGVPKSPTGTLPDEWHQGAVTFTDRIWELDLISRSARYIIDVSQHAGAPVDMVGLSVDPRSDVLVFQNKADGSLWGFNL